MSKKVLLLGNPNVGKSVVFSRLTGVRVLVSNYPGTTVGITSGFLSAGEERLEVVDLPGTYSLEPSSKAEEVAASLLEQEKEEAVVINVIDATNLERNLYLTLQLLERGHRVIICLNMCDDTVHRGITIDAQVLERILGVPVISTCAVTGVGIKHLIEHLIGAKQLPRAQPHYQDRWQEIGRIITQVQRLSHRHHTLREILEDASVRPVSGLLMAAGILFAAFKIVRFSSEWAIARVLDPLFFNLYQPLLEKLSATLGQEGIMHHILIGQLINGSIDFKQSLGVLTTAPYIEFSMVLPYVVSFYFVLSLLEDIGYLPRLAILLDSLFHRLGLHGFAIIPALLGFGCNVPGILGTRTLESKRERFIAATLISIAIPCVALQAVILGLLGKFSGFYVAGVYLVLFAVWIVLGLILNALLKGYSPELLLEIPPYRWPPIAMLSRKVIIRIKGFLLEAIPIVLLGVLAINILLLTGIFNTVTGFFAPLITGVFGLPKDAVIALGIGFIRKDVAAGMLMVLDLTAKQLFIAATLLAVSFPCCASFVVLLKELGLKDFIRSCLIMILTTVVVGGILNLSIVK